MSEAIATVAKCERCNSELDESEREPLRDEEWLYLCCSCEHEVCEFTCCQCENYENNRHQDDFLVVFEPVDWRGKAGEAKPGIYKITGHPYHGGYLIGESWLYADKLRWVRDLPRCFDADSQDFPCGHLCLACQEKYARAKRKV